jgi:hypothetical protein
MPLSQEQVTRIAGLELNALRFTGVIPEALERAQIASAGTPIFDINGTLLFYRVPITRGRRNVGYADIGANEVLGEPLLAASTGIAWNEKAILKEAAAAARKERRALKFNSIRFVAYSFPRLTPVPSGWTGGPSWNGRAGRSASNGAAEAQTHGAMNSKGGA